MSIINTVLFELGVEEIPAKYMKETLRQLQVNLEKLLIENRIHFEKVISLGTPRRLIALIENVAEVQNPLEEKVKGPSKAKAYVDGSPSKVLLGFLKGNKVSEEDIVFDMVGKYEYVFIIKRVERSFTKILLEKVLSDLIHSIKFPKSMRWGDYELRFVRPIRWIVALFNQEVIPVSVEGLCTSKIKFGLKTRTNYHML